MPAIDVNQITLFLNLGFAVLIALFALIGFIRGTYKSTIYFAVTIVILIGGWLMIPALTNFILGYDLSSFNLSFNGITFTTFDATLKEILNNMFPAFNSMMEQSADFAALFNGIIGLIARILLYILIVFIAFSLIGGNFAFILWLIVRPRKKDGKRRKKSIYSRLGGLAIGGVKGALLFLLISFPLAGIASIGSTIASAVSNVEATGTSHFHAVVIDDSMIVVDRLILKFYLMIL